MSDIYRKNEKSDGIARRTGAHKKEDKYVLNVEEKSTPQQSYQSNRPAGNGEVYFANYQKNKKTMAEKLYESSYESADRTDKATKKNDPLDDSTRLFTAATVAAARKSSPSNRPAPRTQPRPSTNVPKANSGDPYDRFKAASSPKNANSRMNSGKSKDKGSINISESFRAEKTKLTAFKDEMKTKYARKKSEPNFMKRMLFSVISIVLVTCLLSAVGIGCINDVLAINGTSDEITVKIPEGSSTGDIISILKDNGLIHNKLFCKMFAAFRGYNDVDDYITGVYDLKTEMGLEGMLNEMREMSSYSDDDIVTLSFPEGWTVQQIMDRLADNEILTKQKFTRALTFNFDYDFINKDANAAIPLEGVMFPDTYEFFVGESASSVMRKFLDNFKEKWTAEYQQRADALGLSTTEILTIASIIQKEAANTEQMSGVSAVIHNRLKNSTNYPLLQCDSTGIYVNEYLTEVVPDGNTEKYKEAYDTGYMRTGLPAGPICNPGKDAIVAALYPDSQSTYLYFAHDVNGKIYYANNDLEFSRNLSEIQQVNENANKQYY